MPYKYTVPVICKECGREFPANPAVASKRIYCSNTCRGKDRPRASIEERFWPKVEKTAGCWLWLGATNDGGYGRIFVDRSTGVRPAHRISWELANGPIPEGMNVCHRCDNPLCVRPDHLFLGTQSDNLNDMYRKVRRTVSGSSNGANLTESDVREIRRLHEVGASQLEIAKRYDISRSTVASITQRKTWRHVI